LIALIANARRSAPSRRAISRSSPKTKTNSTRQSTVPSPCARVGMALDFSKRPFASNAPGSFAVKRSPRLRCSQGHDDRRKRDLATEPSLRPGPSTECVSSSRCQILPAQRASLKKRAAKLLCV
jgi:hypothetical protein